MTAKNLDCSLLLKLHRPYSRSSRVSVALTLLGYSVSACCLFLFILLCSLRIAACSRCRRDGRFILRFGLFPLPKLLLELACLHGRTILRMRPSAEAWQARLKRFSFSLDDLSACRRVRGPEEDDGAGGGFHLDSAL